MALDIYSTAAMLPLVRSLKTPGHWILDTYFGSGRSYSDDEKIYFDVEVDSQQVAPFVSPMMAGKVMSEEGRETRSFAPAYIKPKHDIRPNEVIIRQPGEPLLGNLTPQQRAPLILARKLALQSGQIQRRWELMAAEFARTGKIVVKGENYPERIVDFRRDAALTIDLTIDSAKRWGETGVSPIDDLERWFGLTGEKSNAAPSICTMTEDAWSLVKEDPKFDKMLDRTRGQDAAVSLGFKPGVPGSPTYKGRLGSVDFYTYNDTFRDPVTNAITTLLPPYTVMWSAPGALEGALHFGAILDEDAGFQSVDIFPKSWTEKDPSVRWLLSQSAPLPVPRRPNACGCAKVR